ncbi:hypothetical protein sphantq_01497 [Sphingobium sp. AntQ-1]|uniref:hypothetical protein n=1 Tax=Sphingobium sp. AntQ-1 TaxID=2930091 RepID=UPI00234E5370|nr:hypothetical protein [Sphingobium sp. AntQ-1]WCP13080.1 hypothetical protein sphantq_01497 [Sphingobium sp. AntQ-1]
MTVADIEQRIAIIRSEPGFDIPSIWLTFYLTAAPERLDSLADELGKLQGVNLGDGEGGFLYPKLPVLNSSTDIKALIERVADLAVVQRVEVIAVDADTTADPSTSQFAQIILYDGNVS